ncbi:MAG: PDZ domain-containing protein, partial [Pseudomonadota bacterium]
NPFGLDWTLTTGIVSALEREIPRGRGAGGGFISGLVQTDAAINPGNSGGPLLDSAGRLIGVNTAIYSPSGSSAGIGFAVPVDTVNRVVPRLITNGTYRPPAIGISVDAQAQAMARARGIEGVLVLGITEGSPAAGAGLAPAAFDGRGGLIPGDVIIGIDGQTVRGLDDLDAILQRHEPGDEVTLTLSRDGQRRDVAIALAAAS